MATITQQPARAVKTVSGNPPEIGHYPEAASQSFKQGQFVYLSSGKVTVCGDGATAILGMAAHDASGTTNQDVAVYMANQDTIFEMNVYHSNAASAITAITQPGSTFALQVDSNKCYCDIEDTTNTAFQVRALSAKDAVGDQYGRVEAMVLTDISQVGPDEKN